MLSSVAAVRYRIVFQFCRSEYYFERFFSGPLYFFVAIQAVIGTEIGQLGR